jgi:hypothetical protein
MKIKLELDKAEIERISIDNLAKFLKHYNNDKTEAYFKRRGDEFIEITIFKKESFEDICNSSKINHFTDEHNYLEWLHEENEKKKTKSFRIK